MTEKLFTGTLNHKKKKKKKTWDLCLTYFEINGTKAYEETSTDEETVVNSHSNELHYKFAVKVIERQDKLPTMYGLPKLPYKAKFIANSSSCATRELSKLLTSCLTAVKSRVIRYYETVYERSRKICFCL